MRWPSSCQLVEPYTVRFLIEYCEYIGSHQANTFDIERIERQVAGELLIPCTSEYAPISPHAPLQRRHGHLICGGAIGEYSGSVRVEDRIQGSTHELGQCVAGSHLVSLHGIQAYRLIYTQRHSNQGRSQVEGGNPNETEKIVVEKLSYFGRV